jgi:hypothetical protein
VNRLDGAPVPSAAHSCSPVAHSRSPAAPLTSSAVRAASLAMADLQVELEHRRSGENGHITIDCHRERRHNLDGDFGAADTTPVRQAARAPASPVGSGVVACRLPHILHGGLAA